MKKYYGPLINLYALLLVYCMFFGFGREAIGYHEPQIHMFATINRYFTGNYDFLKIYHNIFDNIFVFMPFGFLGLLYPSLKSFPKLIVTFVIGISFVEFLQWFSQLGFADIDDVLLNTTGVIIGYIAFMVLEKQYQITSSPKFAVA